MKNRTLFFLGIVSLFFIFVVASIIQILWVTLGWGFPLALFVYVLLLLAWVSASQFFRLKSDLSMKIGLMLFISASLLAVFGLFNFSEPVFRFSLVFWLVGVFQALIEYNRADG